MFGAAGLLLGALVVVAPGLVSAHVEARRTPDLDSLPDWAREMLTGPEDHVLKMAGNYEMAAARDLDDLRLVPCFERLLDLAIDSRAEIADIAGACAARTLERFGRADHISRRLGAILAHKNLPMTTEAALHAVKVVHERQRLGTYK